MENNELQKIKDEKLKFLMLRKEIIGASCKEMKSQISQYKEFISKHPEYEKNPFFKNPSIKASIMENLKYDGFDLNDEGTKHLANLILMFFHERKLYRIEEPQYKNYWDLDDPSNEHYKMFGISPENLISYLLISIEQNEDTRGCSIGEIVYTETDYIGYYGRDRDDKNRVPYKNILKR